jgi:hyperosmotically inducible protein
MTGLKNKVLALAITLFVGASVVAAAPQSSSDQDNVVLAKQVRKQLVTLPYYGVFDNLAYEINGDTVVLSGQVVRASTRKDAERRVAKLEGVDRVINRIEVLPLSSFDNSIRVRTFRAVFRTGGLFRYSQGANPSIHIVVNRGHVTLEGVVSNEMDKRLAYIAANGVSGVFSVTNNLRIASNS